MELSQSFDLRPDLIELIASTGGASLLGRDIAQLARQQLPQLPPTPDIGFECRLGEGSELVDIFGLLMVSELQQVREGAHNAQQAGSAWPPIADELLALPAAIRQMLFEVFLEFDQVSVRRFNAEPSIFLTFSDDASSLSLSSRMQLALATIAQLEGCTAQDRKKLEALNASLNAAAVNLQSFGFMRGRAPACLRLNLSAAGLDELHELYDSFGLAPANELLDAWSALSAAGAIPLLAVDVVGGQALAPASVEIGLPSSGTEPVLMRVLGWLSDHNYCTDDKRRELEQFNRVLTPLNASLSWPDTLVAESLLLPGNVFSVVRQHVTHFKLSWSGRDAGQAKVYLAFQRLVMSAAELYSEN